MIYVAISFIFRHILLCCCKYLASVVVNDLRYYYWI